MCQSRALRTQAPPPSVSSLDLSSLLSVLSQAESALLRRQEELQVGHTVHMQSFIQLLLEV